jgi:hypothetical protein
MRRVLPLVFLSLFALVPVGDSSPLGGTSSTDKAEVGAAPWTATRTFRGGERACVLAFSRKHDPVVNLHLIVSDAKGNVVAEDQAHNNLVGDYVGVVWYPARTGEYKIELRSPQPTQCYVAIK